MSQQSSTVEHIESLIRQGDFPAAEAACDAALVKSPAEHKLWAWLGTLRLAQGRVADAEAPLRQAISLSPHEAVYWNSLGDCFFGQQRWQPAIEAYQQALAGDPNNAESWRNLGAAAHAVGHLDQAEQAFDRSLALIPGDPNTRIRYALLQVDRGNLDRAIEFSRAVLAQMPDLIPAWLIIGNAERLRVNWSAAAAAYREAIKRAPRDRDARFNLGRTLLLDGKFMEAEAWLRQLVLEHPNDSEAWTVLGGTLHAQARLGEALEALQHSIVRRPDPFAHSVLLMSLHYDSAQSPEQIVANHRMWDALYARPLAPAVPPAARGDVLKRGLRIGFIAQDFNGGPTGCLGLKLLECLDKSLCSIVCYSDRLAEDDFTARFRAAANLWRVCTAVSDQALAEQVRRDEIDVLVDLGGHVGRRLLVFARRPAALQLTWLGYVGTTGLTAMDGLIADRFHVRPGEELSYSEAVLRLPHDYICYGTPHAALHVAPLPALTTGRVTFGCFNNPAKYSPPLYDAWSSILQRVPTSRLLLKYNGLDQPELQVRLRAEFARRGVTGERIEFQGRSTNLDTMRQYDQVDLALDTQPYSGGLTTCEALWMGVPVICCPGGGFASRHSTSHVSNAGYGQFVAEDMEQYVAKAVEWANRLDELAIIRSQMREQVAASPLCDGPGFARDWLALVREAYAAKRRAGDVSPPVI
ncbi:MAG TPA: tetratricopeptide repeat protein [Pirellulaceae bacterium]